METGRQDQAAANRVKSPTIANISPPLLFSSARRSGRADSEWAKAYYEHLRNDEKKDHHAAVRSLAFKWIRITFRCWQDRKPYD
jgi:hypothetical protein